MNLISVNIGQERTQQRKTFIETTGIYKFPVQESVEIKSLGIEQDVICDKKSHGGPDQAIYVYGGADYAWWSRELRKEISPGTFGENLTISDLESAQLNIGDFIHVGNVTLQVTAPRIPCGTFATRMDDPQWVKRFRYAERPGLYCRVAKEGFVKAGEPVSIERYTNETISLLEMFREYYNKNKSVETLQRLLKAPIAIGARRDLENDLQKPAREEGRHALRPHA
jgi:MOSC domain-containing protein YiiM